MPLFEYRCRACGKSFEALVTTRKSQAILCTHCDSSEIEQLIGLPSPGRVANPLPATNCRGDGPPCGLPECGRKGS